MKKHLYLLLLLVSISVCISAQTTLFNSNWQFHKGDIPNGQSETVFDSIWRKLELPHDWSIEGPFSNQWASGTGFLPGGIGWYRKSFSLKEVQPGDKVFLYFDGVYKNSEVWLNGSSLGKRPNGYIPFYYELTPFLKKDNNFLAVKVDHTKFADSRWYPGSGIYRNVYLVVKKAVHIPIWGVAFTTPEVDTQKAKANVVVEINNSGSDNASVIVEAKLSRAGKVVATAASDINLAGNTTQNARLIFQVNQPQLWSPESPNLYTLTVSVHSNGKKVDEYVEKVGFRNFRFDAAQGFFLNGKNMKMKGICIHHDAGALGAAVPREVWHRRLIKMKEAGANAIRMSHYPHQDYMYELCDELGFLVQDEAFDEWEHGKNKWIEGWNVGKPGQDGYHEYFNEWAEKDVRDMVMRNRNHASIIMWSIGNEIDYPNDPYSHEVLNTGRNPQIYGRGYNPNSPPASRLGDLSQKLAAVVRSIDTTRAVTAALAGVVMSNTTSYPQNLDVVGYNYQEYRYAEDHAAYPNRIIYGSENNRSADAWRAVDTSKNIFGQFLWTGFDFMGEAGRWPARSSTAGLMDLAGFPKADFYTRQTLWTNKPVAYLMASRYRSGPLERGMRGSRSSWNWNSGDSLRVNCITNAEEAELFLNGKSLGVRLKKDTVTRGLNWIVQYEPGELLVKTNASTFKLVTSEAPAKLIATADKTYFHQGEKETAHIEIFVKDAKGNQVFEANNEITIDISGPAKLLGLESGDISSHEDYKSNKRKTFNGRLLAYIQSTGDPQAVKVTISSAGLPPVTVSFRPVKP